MKYWTIVTPDEASSPIYETLSEDEIVKGYWVYWSTRMIAKYGEKEFNNRYVKQDCIDDWAIIHGAWESKD